MTKFTQANSVREIDAARDLFLEYAESLDFDLCFQDFDRELADLPGEYAQPEGRLLLAVYRGEVAGCVALRKAGEGVCEMKRLWVRPQYRGFRIGRNLVNRIISEAKQIGYCTMMLDTIFSMKDAIALYETLGFKRAEPYYENPVEGAIYMELNLQ